MPKLTEHSSTVKQFSNRLGGWPRLGVAVSTLWAVCVLIFSIYAYNTAQNNYDSNFVYIERVYMKTTPELMEIPKGLSVLEVQLIEEVNNRIKRGEWRNSVSKKCYNYSYFFKITFLPVIVLWLLGFLSITFAKWVLNGFSKNNAELK